MTSLEVVHITTVPMSLTFLRGQVAFMREHGMQVSGISSPGSDLEMFGEQLGINIDAVEMPRRISPVRDMIAIVQLVRILRSRRPSIAHAHTPKGGLLGMIAATIARVPVRVYHMRGLPLMSAGGWRRLLLLWTEKVSCFLADRVIAVSASLREVALAERLVAPSKIVVLSHGSGNGVDAVHRFNPATLPDNARADTRSRLGIPADAVVIGFVGRLVRDKGVVELAEAWRQLSKDERLHLMVVGPAEDRDALPPTTLQALRDHPRVHMVGMDWNTPPLYAAMDIVALPTYREGFPNVPLEAAAMELPVVATDVTGCRDAVEDGVSGKLITVRDAQALTAALRYYVDHPTASRGHGEAGRARVLAMFRPEAIWQALYDEYVHLMSRKCSAVQIAAASRSE